MDVSDLINEEQDEYLKTELRSAADRLYDLSRLLDRSWSDPGAVSVKRRISYHIRSLEELCRDLRRGKSSEKDWGSNENGTSYAEESDGMSECLWDSNGMRLLCEGLSENRKQIRRIAAYYKENEENSKDLPEKTDGEVLLKTLRDTENTESAVIESILKIDRIYQANESAIADYFDLAVQRVPPTELGTSTFAHLSAHEEQMPFEK